MQVSIEYFAYNQVFYCGVCKKDFKKERYVIRHVLGRLAKTHNCQKKTKNPGPWVKIKKSVDPSQFLNVFYYYYYF